MVVSKDDFDGMLGCFGEAVLLAVVDNEPSSSCAVTFREAGDSDRADAIGAASTPDDDDQER
jgi:hypothetical protein